MGYAYWKPFLMEAFFCRKSNSFKSKNVIFLSNLSNVSFDYVFLNSAEKFLNSRSHFCLQFKINYYLEMCMFFNVRIET